MGTGPGCASCRQGLQVLRQSLSVEPGQVLIVNTTLSEGVLAIGAGKQGGARPKMQGRRLAGRGQHIVPSWHFGMLNDHPRNQACLSTVVWV